MIYKTFENFSNGENTYLLMDEKTKDAILIDPGYMRDYGCNFNLKYIFLTHSHYDHISDVPGLKKDGVKIVCSKNCADNISDKNVNLSELGLGYSIEETADIILEDGEVFDFCGEKIKCIYTPGHTNGSCCYLIEDRLYSGDTLFLQNVGRCDLPTGNMRTLYRSVKEKIFTLSDNTDVFPGHGDKTTVGFEKTHSLFFK